VGSAANILPTEGDTVYFELQKAIAFVSTACQALESVHDERNYEATVSVGEPVQTLRSGVDALRVLLPKIDVAIHGRAVSGSRQA
jgi:hypothetical protein